MKQILITILVIGGLFGFTTATTIETTENAFPEHEQEMIIEMDQKDLPATTTQEQRELRCQQKQEIKNKILELYKELKDEKIKGVKKETRHQIAELKKQLRTINTKIAYSYKRQLKRFFGLK